MLQKLAKVCRNFCKLAALQPMASRRVVVTSHMTSHGPAKAVLQVCKLLQFFAAFYFTRADPLGAVVKVGIPKACTRHSRAKHARFE